MAKKNQTTSLKPDAQAPQPPKPYPGLKRNVPKVSLPSRTGVPPLIAARTVKNLV